MLPARRGARARRAGGGRREFAEGGAADGVLVAAGGLRPGPAARRVGARRADHELRGLGGGRGHDRAAGAGRRCRRGVGRGRRRRGAGPADVTKAGRAPRRRAARRLRRGRGADPGSRRAAALRGGRLLLERFRDGVPRPGNGSTAPARREPAGLLRRAAGRGGAGRGDARRARARGRPGAAAGAAPVAVAGAGPGGARGRPVLRGLCVATAAGGVRPAVRAVPRDARAGGGGGRGLRGGPGDRRTKTGARGLPDGGPVGAAGRG